MTNKTKNPTQQANAWNKEVNVGDTVEYRSFPSAEPQIFTTRTPAEVIETLSEHTVVLWLNGKSGCVDVEACRKVHNKDH